MLMGASDEYGKGEGDRQMDRFCLPNMGPVCVLGAEELVKSEGGGTIVPHETEENRKVHLERHPCW